MQNSKNYSEWESCLLESLQLWRICLLYGLDQDSVQNMMRSIHNIITKCKDNKMSFSNNFGILVERFMYSIYSAYFISIHQSINDVKAVPESVYNETKVHVTEAVKLLSSFSNRSNHNGSTTSIDYFRLSGPLHFLAMEAGKQAFKSFVAVKVIDNKYFLSRLLRDISSSINSMTASSISFTEFPEAVVAPLINVNL